MTSPAAEEQLTIRSLVDETIDVLHSYVRDQEQRTSLAADISAIDLTFTATDSSQISRGLVQIDDELVVVAKIDTTSGVATVEPWGRAQSGSTATSHTTGAPITQSPLFPRQRIATAIYAVLREVFPDLYAIGEIFLDINPARTNYPMPTDCFHIFSVEWNLPGPTGMWAPVDRWRQNKTATGVEVEVIGRTWPGQGRVRVKYMRNPLGRIQGTDDLLGYGYDYQIRDVLVLGAAARVAAFVETSRVQTESVESHGRSEAVPAGSAMGLSRYLYGLFRTRLEGERQQKLLRYPIQIHWTR
jgi:hypothetical protein